MRFGAGLAARALALRARRVGGQPQADRDALDRVGEPDRRRGLDVGAAHRPGRLWLALGAARAAEEVAEDVAEAPGVPADDVVDVEAARRAETATAEPARERSAGDLRAVVVVRLALLGVAEDVVGLGDGLEGVVLLRVTRVGVGVVRPGELAVGLLDVGLARVLADAEDLVEVLGRPVGADLGHPPSPPFRGLGRDRLRRSDRHIWFAGASSRSPGSTTSTCAARTTRSPMR